MESRRTLLKTLGVFVSTSLVARASARSVLASPPARSPHAEALSLVFDTQRETIHELELTILTAKNPEAFGEEPWWFDTLPRMWSVQRPISPGRVDSTHWFDVSLSIENVIVGTWSVDTAKRTVSAVRNSGDRTNMKTQ